MLALEQLDLLPVSYRKPSLGCKREGDDNAPSGLGGGTTPGHYTAINHSQLMIVAYTQCLPHTSACCCLAQGTQFGLKDVEVVTATVDLDEVVSYRYDNDQGTTVQGCSMTSIHQY